MGGCQSQYTAMSEPVGDPIDPLELDGDIIDNIKHDPHIHLYKQKIQEVLMPLRKAKGPIRTTKQIQIFATTSRKQHQKYIQTVNQAIKTNTVSATNILSFMLQELADSRQRGKVQNKLNPQDQYAALKCFVYLYTGSYTYKKMNTLLRRTQYQKMAKVIGIVKKQLESYNKEHFSRRLKANSKNGRFLDLFRGIPKPDKMMIKGRKMYWRSFTSTSLDRKIATNFGRYQYILQLDSKQPHDYLVVPKEMSPFDQEQIIIFPYMYFECNEVQDFTNGAAYRIKQILPQN